VSVPSAFFGVVLIWATTPLAIKWSSEGPGFLFGVASRMVLGVFVCLLLVALMSRRMRWHRKALLTYLAGGLGVWAAMTSVYWGAQFIPSGLVSVIFGFSPVVTGVMAAIWLGERAFTPFKILGMLFGVSGLGLVFGQSIDSGWSAVAGMAAVLFSVHVHAASAVWIKRIDAGIAGLETTTGALIVAVPLFALNWLLFDGQWPSAIEARSAWAIVYLAVFGSALGFILYYYVLRHLEASRVALITLMTPLLALFLGQSINHEQISVQEWFGTAVVLFGLACYQWGAQLGSLLSQRVRHGEHS
jgi:drug/metabolite transporter (DMT)-like permease